MLALAEAHALLESAAEPVGGSPVAQGDALRVGTTLVRVAQTENVPLAHTDCEGVGVRVA